MVSGGSAKGHHVPSLTLPAAPHSLTPILPAPGSTGCSGLKIYQAGTQ